LIPKVGQLAVELRRDRRPWIPCADVIKAKEHPPGRSLHDLH
jgi:hypothetical protein